MQTMRRFLVVVEEEEVVGGNGLGWAVPEMVVVVGASNLSSNSRGE